MVERSLSMREVPGSMPGFSNCVFFSFLFTIFKFCSKVVLYCLFDCSTIENRTLDNHKCMKFIIIH